MLTTIALAATMALPFTMEEAREYFPLNPGDKWVYDEEGADGSMRTTDTVGEITTIIERVKVGETMTIKETECTPVITSRGGVEQDRVYYTISEGEVRVVAFSEKRTIESPYPILRLPGRSSKWSHRGDTVMGEAPADLNLEGSVKKIGRREFDGKRVDAIEVRLKATLLEAMGTPFTVTQVGIYGKGIGLLSMRMETKLPKRTIKSKRTLVSYTPKTSE